MKKQAKKAAKSSYRKGGYQLTLGESLELKPQYDKGSDGYKTITNLKGFPFLLGQRTCQIALCFEHS